MGGSKKYWEHTSTQVFRAQFYIYVLPWRQHIRLPDGRCAKCALSSMSSVMDLSYAWPESSSASCLRPSVLLWLCSWGLGGRGGGQEVMYDLGCSLLSMCVKQMETKCKAYFHIKEVTNASMSLTNECDLGRDMLQSENQAFIWSREYAIQPGQFKWAKWQRILPVSNPGFLRGCSGERRRFYDNFANNFKGDGCTIRRCFAVNHAWHGLLVYTIHYSYIRLHLDKQGVSLPTRSEYTDTNKGLSQGFSATVQYKVHGQWDDYIIKSTRLTTEKRHQPSTTECDTSCSPLR